MKSFKPFMDQAGLVGPEIKADLFSLVNVPKHVYLMESMETGATEKMP